MKDTPTEKITVLESLLKTALEDLRALRELREQIDPPKPAAIDPGAGYRLLKEGEKIESADEARGHGNGRWYWFATLKAGSRVGDRGTGKHYRRKLPAPPAPEYRPLLEGELIQAGDEYRHQGGAWKPVVSSVGRCQGTPGISHLEFRRRKQNEGGIF